MNRNIRNATLGVVIAGGSLLAGPGFAMDDLAQGYMLAAGDAAKAGEGKCGEGKCGEGKCGMDKVDADKDGRVSQAEFVAAHPDKAEQFGDIDANQDGFIDEAERKAWHASKAGEGKCGGAEQPKAGEGKCGEGKCGEGSCGGSM